MEYIKGNNAKKLGTVELFDVEELTSTGTSASISNYKVEDHGICDIEDSLALCLDTLGKVDIHYMAWLSASDEKEIINVHNGKTIVQRPEKYYKDRLEYDNWVLIVDYLRGNLYRLMKRASKLNMIFPGRFDANIKVIKQAMPERPDITDVHAQLGSSWIDAKYVEAFIQDLFDLSFRPKVLRCDGQWKIKLAYMPVYVTNNYTYGTERMSAIRIIEHTLNAATIKIMDEVPADTKSGYKKVTNKELTYIAQSKQQLIMRKFSQWIETHPEIQASLAKDYYETYSYITKNYDGSYLRLKDKNPAVTLYAHQLNAIARIILTRNTVLCHDVGSGKTYCYAAAVHELYRMGISKKNMIVVPNNVFNDAVRSHRFLYPQDNLLTISPDDFKPEDRLATINKMRDGDYTAIYIAASKFDMLGMSLDYQIEALSDEYDELSDKRNQADSRWAETQLKKKQQKISKKNDKLVEEYEEDDRDCFDKLGITTLVIDEVHNYKNVSIETSLENVVGMHKSGSHRADSLLEKVRQVQKTGGRIVFATGTLLTNSISDLYVFQRFLQPHTMDDCSVSTFGEWANTFGSITSSFEVDVTSQDFRYMTRLSHFHNLPELMALFSGVCDFYHINDGDMQLPKFNGYKDIVVNKTAYHDDYNKEIVARTDLCRNGRVSPKDDNILNIVMDGRKSALDIRMVIPEAFVSENECKAGVCAREVAELYYAHPGTTQIIFCDLSTPKKEWNVYDEIKRYLVKRGIPAKEIAYIQSAKSDTKKNKLLREFEEGNIRVMIGSTQMLGVGVNVQKNLLALHHIDAPWRPSDLSQREGRLIRQGNLNPEVFIYRYMTAGSFDSYVWQILENKQHFIGSFLAGSMSQFHRDETDVDMVMLDYSEVKALAIGNPLIKERIETANTLERTKISRRQREKQLAELTRDVPNLTKDIQKQQAKIAGVEQDIEFYDSHKISLDETFREHVGQGILNALVTNIMKTETKLHTLYMGFEIHLPKDMHSTDRHILVRRKGGEFYRVDVQDKSPVSITRSIDGVLRGFTRRREKLEKGLLEMTRKLDIAKDELAKGNPYTGEVLALEERLQEIDDELNVDDKRKEK